MDIIKQHYDEDDIYFFKKKPIKRRFSTIQKCDVLLPSGNKETLLIKKYHKGCFSDIQDRAKREYRISKSYRLKFQHNNKYHIINYIAFIPDELILISQYIEGIDLFDLFNAFFSIKRKIKQLFFDCGEFLNKFHSIENRLEYFNFKDLLKYIDIRLRKLSNTCDKYFSEDLREKIIYIIKKNIQKYADKKLLNVGLHGDYIPPNIRISENNKLFLLDFSNYRYGLIYDDIGYFISFFFYGMQFLSSSKKKQCLIKRFLMGYNFTLEQPLLNLFVLKHLINLAWGTLKNLNNKEYRGIKNYYYYYVYNRLVDQISSICINSSKNWIW